MFGFVPRSLAVVGIAGVLTFAVPVSAQALVLPSPKVAGEMVIGAVRAAAPKIATAATFAGRASPVGTLLTVGQLMYMTRDSWMPWVQNEFGVGGTTSEVPAGTLTHSLAWGVGFGGGMDGGRVIVAVTRVSLYGTINADYQCRSALGVITSGPHYSWYMSTSSGTKDAGGCAAGLTLYSATAVMSGNGAASNTLRYGVPFDAQTDATYRVSVDCELVDGTISTIFAETVSPQGGGLAVPSCAAAFPGSHGVKMLVDGARTGSPLVKQYQADWARTSVLYPNCVGAGVACSYVLRYNNIPCVAGQTQCIGWALKQDLDSEAGKYECWFGPYLLTLADCGILERAYEAGGTTLTKVNTDGDPRTFDVTDPSGNPIPEPGAVPTPAPGAPGGAPAPIDPTTPLPSPTPGGTTTASCWPTGSAMWNPLDWVMRPVQCALVWAFVPKTVDTTSIRTQLDRAGIAPSITALSTAVGSLGGTEGGCSGPSVSFDIATVHQVVTPFAACTAPMSTVASYAYAFISVVTVIGGASKIIASIGAGFGFGGPPPTWQQGTLF